jgi:uncharacterized membrane protein
MNLLIFGMLLWSLTHLFPSAMHDARSKIVAALGNNAYRGLFSLLIAASLLMIIFGWKSATLSGLYVPPLFGSILPSILLLIAFILLVAAQTNTNIKRFVRHPQLTGVAAWGIAHLLTNGESRSVVLFGGMTLWALVMMILCGRRDGPWQKPGPVALGSDIVTVVVGVIAYGVLLYAHQFLFGVTPIANFPG